MSAIDKTRSRFSIVTVCFNNLDEVIETYRSIQDQSEKYFEWILVDGSQSDAIKSWFIGIEEKSSFPAQLISEKDAGVYDGMNKGLSIAAGDYITFLNSGDSFYSEEVLARVRDATASKPMLIYGDAVELYPDGDEQLKVARHWSKCDQGMFAHHQSMFYLRETIKNYRYELTYKVAADYQLTCRLISEPAFLAQYIPYAICKFSVGGLSFQANIRGRREALCVRLLTLEQPMHKAIFVYALQWAAFLLKTKMPVFYKLLRYKRSSYG